MAKTHHGQAAYEPSAVRSQAASDACAVLCLNLDVAERLRRERPAVGAARRLAAAAAALADPTRVALAWALREAGELCVCDLAWVLERPQNAVSHHLRRMREAGIVDFRRNGRMVIYYLTARGQELLDALLPVAATPSEGAHEHDRAAARNAPAAIDAHPRD